MAAELHPVPEFATFAAHVPDIIRPKPRRLSDVRQNHSATAVIVVGSNDRCLVPPTQIRAPGDGAAPGSTSSSSHFPELNCADLENDVFRDDATTEIAECTPLRVQRPLQRNLAGGSAPALHRPRPRSSSRPRPHTPHAAASAESKASSSASIRQSPSEMHPGREFASRSNSTGGSLIANREKFSGLDVLNGNDGGTDAVANGDLVSSYEGEHQETSPCEEYEVYDIDAANILVGGERRAGGSSSLSNSDSLSSTEKGEVRRRSLPQRMKQRRRNILSFPQSFDLLLQQQQQQKQKSRYDSSGHASMTESNASDYALSPCGITKESEGPSSAAVFDPEQLLRKLNLSTGNVSVTNNGTNRSQRSAVSTDSDEQIVCTSLSSTKKSSPRVFHQSSVETVATTITSNATDEFVWLDSTLAASAAQRLAPLQRPPWSASDLHRALENSTKLRDFLPRISHDSLPKLAFLLQRPLARIAREAQRFARAVGVCGKSEVISALWVVLPPWLAHGCVKACHRSAAIFGGASCSRQSKSSRAGLSLSVGLFHRWALDNSLGPSIPDMAAVFLTASLENILEETVLASLRCYEKLNASSLDSALSQSGDLFGLFQPYVQLSSSRSSLGVPELPRWPVQIPARGDEHSMLTTCVAGINELDELITKALHLLNMAMRPAWGNQVVRWSSAGTRALFHYTRCSQLEHSQTTSSSGVDATGKGVGPPGASLASHVSRSSLSNSLMSDHSRSQPLPPLIEWVRVAAAFAVHRHNSFIVDDNDVLQAARMLLPGIDCPIRTFGIHEEPVEFLPDKLSSAEAARLINSRASLRLLSSTTRLDVVHSVLKQLPNGVNTLSEEGLSALMTAAIRGDEASIKCLLSAGADPELATPGCSNVHPGVRPECHLWTAVSYAAAHGHVGAVKALLEGGAQVEGGGESQPTDTPLQLATAAANNDLITLLLSFGAHPYLSTSTADTQSYAQGGLARTGSPSPVALAAAHGHRAVLHRLVSHPLQGSSPQAPMSLEEILSEGSQSTLQRKTRHYKFSKNQWRCLQEAMYHSAENGFLDVTLDLRNMGVPWTLHSWNKSLAACHELGRDNTIEEILREFQPAWVHDLLNQLTEDTVPLLFNLFSFSKTEGVTLLVADVLSQVSALCGGNGPPVPLPAPRPPAMGPRIDARFVNSAEMSDVRFVVEGRPFYAHRIILVNASPRFAEMLHAASTGGSDQLIAINDIRYSIFQMVMEYLYKGGFDGLTVVSPQDCLELLTAAHYFQLEPLIAYCEHICSKTVTVENIVPILMHARVYHAQNLLDFCLRFILHNLVALLSYDGDVRKIIFNTGDLEVLEGLKRTLQKRLRYRTTCSSHLPVVMPGKSPIV